MKNIFASLASTLVLVSSAVSTRADVVAESLQGFALSFASHVGQSFTTGPAAQYSGLSFNLFLTQGNPSSDPYADPAFTFYLLSKEFLGFHNQLSPSTSGFIARTTGVRGNQWVFDPSVTLLGNTQYWLYASTTGPNPPSTQVAVGGGHSGGHYYFSGTPFQPDDRFDLAFTISSNPVPDPVALVSATYGAPVIDSGPLSLGLSELPAEPRPKFTLRDGTPLGGGSIGYRLADVISAEFIFGDVIGPNNIIAPNNLTEFYLEVDADGAVSALSYTFAAIDTATAAGVIGMNIFIGENGFIGMEGVSFTEMPFSVTGTDILSGQAFAYTYADTALRHIRSKSLLDVIYDTPVINTGPLSFGLSELPAEPQPAFSLGEGTPTGGGATGYGLDDVISARLVFGDGIFTRLTAFDMEVLADGTVETLSYAFAATNTPTAEGIIIINFPLTVTGTDTASGEAFSYSYANSTPTVAPVADPIPLALRVVGLIGDTLTLALNNIRPGQTFHLRQSTDLANFEPLSPPIDITDATRQPVAITVNKTTHPRLFFTVYAGPSPAP